MWACFIFTTNNSLDSFTQIRAGTLEICLLRPSGYVKAKNSPVKNLFMTESFYLIWVAGSSDL